MDSDPTPWPPQVLRTGVVVGTAPVDVGTLTLQAGCHVRGSVIGLSDPASASIGISEQMLLPGGLCGTLGGTLTRLDATGRFDVLVVPGANE